MEFSEDETNILGENEAYAKSAYVPRNLLFADAPPQAKVSSKPKTRVHNPKKVNPAPQVQITEQQETQSMEQEEPSERENGANKDLITDDERFFRCTIPFKKHELAFIVNENRRLFPQIETKGAEIAKLPDMDEKSNFDFETQAFEIEVQQAITIEDHPKSDMIGKGKVNSGNDLSSNLITNESNQAEAPIQEDSDLTAKRTSPAKQKGSKKSPARNRKKIKTEEVTPRRVSARLQAKQLQH